MESGDESRPLCMQAFVSIFTGTIGALISVLFILFAILLGYTFKEVNKKIADNIWLAFISMIPLLFALDFLGLLIYRKWIRPLFLKLDWDESSATLASTLFFLSALIFWIIPAIIFFQTIFPHIKNDLIL